MDTEAQTELQVPSSWSVAEQKLELEISLVSQWLRLHASTEGGVGSIPDQGTRSHMPCGGVQKDKNLN